MAKSSVKNVEVADAPDEKDFLKDELAAAIARADEAEARVRELEAALEVRAKECDATLAAAEKRASEANEAVSTLTRTVATAREARDLLQARVSFLEKQLAEEESLRDAMGAQDAPAATDNHEQESHDLLALAHRQRQSHSPHDAARLLEEYVGRR